MLKICASGPALLEYFFQTKAFIQEFLENGVEFVGPREADLVVCGTFKKLLIYMLRFGGRKKYLLWTIEPRFSKHFTDKVKHPLLPIFHVMNIYTGILENNYLWVPKSNEKIVGKKLLKFTNKRIVSLMTYQAGNQWTLLYQGMDLDLCNLRTEIALEGRKQGIFDIYGRGWPDGISLGQSRGENWREKKASILDQYHFNLCFENTNWPYYCTEKIWHSIQSGCLPIYYGKDNKIYEDFPRESFLDYSEFDSPKSLFSYIQNMGIDEFNERIALCTQVLNQATKRQQENRPYHNLFLRTLDKIRDILNESVTDNP